MKKDLIKRCMVVATMCILMSTLLCSCVNESTQKATSPDPFIPIKGEETNGLVYHKKSNTVYVIFNQCHGSNGYGYCTLYIQNGHFCEYKDGEIVERESPAVTETVEDNN